MPIRKTREELDAEMNQEEELPPDSCETADPSSDESSPESFSGVADQEMPESIEPEVLETEHPMEPGIPDMLEPETEEHPVLAAEQSEEPEAGDDDLSGIEVSPRLKTTIESLLFAAADPLPLTAVTNVLKNFNPEITSREVRKAVEELKTELREQGRGVRIAEVAGGYQLRTPSESAPYVKKLVARRAPRLTRATLECLAIVAYRQPVTRGEVEDIRGVDSGAVLRHLLEKRLVKILGRKEEPGRPLVYGTTKEFLAFFSMKDLNSLPTLQDFAELSEEHRESLGLGPQVPEEDQEEEGLSADALAAEEVDAYSPVGQDEIVQELAEALDDLRRRDRKLKKEVLGIKKEKPDSDQTPPDEKAQPASAESGAGMPENAEPGVEPTAGETNTDQEGSPEGEPRE
jgi:segregation and condensation protein B